MAKWYWYTRAFLRLGILAKPPSTGDITFWALFKKVPLEGRCRVCSKPFWAIGKSEVCDNYSCYVEYKMEKVRDA